MSDRVSKAARALAAARRGPGAAGAASCLLSWWNTGAHTTVREGERGGRPGDELRGRIGIEQPADASGRRCLCSPGLAGSLVVRGWRAWSGCDPKIAPQARVPRAAPGGRPHDRHAGQAVSVGGRMHGHCRRSDRGGSSIDRWERMERAQGSDGGERTGRERERERG